jgi:hypothetical protein
MTGPGAGQHGIVGKPTPTCTLQARQTKASRPTPCSSLHASQLLRCLHVSTEPDLIERASLTSENAAARLSMIKTKAGRERGKRRLGGEGMPGEQRVRALSQPCLAARAEAIGVTQFVSGGGVE